MSEDHADQWEILELPAIRREWRTTLRCGLGSGSLKNLSLLRLPFLYLNGTLSTCRIPTSEEGALIKRDWWQIWEHDDPPPTSYILQSYDTAFSAKETADYSAITTWGVFKPSDGAPESIMLLDAKRGRWDFPDLKDNSLR